jgi:integrase
MAAAAPRSSPLLLADVYPFILRDYQNNGRKSSRNLVTSWKIHLGPHFGSQPARDFDGALVQAYISKRQTAGASNSTINHELNYLKRAANLALQLLATDDDKLLSALGRWSRIRLLKVRNVRTGYLKDSEYEALARETASIGIWLRAMFECAWTYGWRKSELLGLKVNQVDLVERTISLNPGETKNDDGRLVAMTPEVLECLRLAIAGKKPHERVFTRPGRTGSLFHYPATQMWWMRYRDEHGRIQRDTTNTSDRERALEILRGKDHPTPGRAIRDFRKQWESACNGAGVSGLLFHDLRRTGARNMRRSGIDEKVAMGILGQRTRSIFDRYNITDGADLKQAVDKMVQRRRASRPASRPFTETERDVMKTLMDGAGLRSGQILIGPLQLESRCAECESAGEIALRSPAGMQAYCLYHATVALAQAVASIPKLSLA